MNRSQYITYVFPEVYDIPPFPKPFQPQDLWNNNKICFKRMSCSEFDSLDFRLVCRYCLVQWRANLLAYKEPLGESFPIWFLFFPFLLPTGKQGFVDRGCCDDDGWEARAWGRCRGIKEKKQLEAGNWLYGNLSQSIEKTVEVLRTGRATSFTIWNSTYKDGKRKS